MFYRLHCRRMRDVLVASAQRANRSLAGRVYSPRISLSFLPDSLRVRFLDVVARRIEENGESLGGWRKVSGRFYSFPMVSEDAWRRGSVARTRRVPSTWRYMSRGDHRPPFVLSSGAKIKRHSQARPTRPSRKRQRIRGGNEPAQKKRRWMLRILESTAIDHR